MYVASLQGRGERQFEFVPVLKQHSLDSIEAQWIEYREKTFCPL